MPMDGAAGTTEAAATPAATSGALGHLCMGERTSVKCKCAGKGGKCRPDCTFVIVL